MPKYGLSKEIKIQCAAMGIIGLFENLLHSHGIKIPSEDREGFEGEACIYGKEYYTLEDSIIDILKEYK